MAATLQSRVQLLAILAVAFILVSVPLFYQVRADAAESRETAKSTFLSKFFRDVAHDMKANENLQVEDAWQKWQEEHPDCGPECDPKADPDGDGVPNQEEVERGRNPNCNEEKEGEDYCKGRPEQPPPANAPEPLDDILFEKVDARASVEYSFHVATGKPNYDRWEITWSVTGYQGFGDYQVILRDGQGSTLGCCASDSVDGFPLSDQDDGRGTLDGSRVPPSGADYSIQVDSSAFQGTWHLVVRGVRDTPDS
jgi:hypothetical protein